MRTGIKTGPTGNTLSLSTITLLASIAILAVSTGQDRTHLLQPVQEALVYTNSMVHFSFFVISIANIKDIFYQYSTIL